MRTLVITAFLILIMGTSLAWAHGDGHGPATTSPPNPGKTQATLEVNQETPHEAHNEGPSTYGMDMEADEIGGEGTYGIETDSSMKDHSGHENSMSSAEPGLFEDSLMGTEPAAPSVKHDAGHEMASHKKHVEPTSFTRVSSDAPGHSMAIGLTIFVGFTFGLLTLIRPFEK